MQNDQDVSKALDALEDAINEHVDRIADTITDLLVAVQGKTAAQAEQIAALYAATNGAGGKLH